MVRPKTRDDRRGLGLSVVVAAYATAGAAAWITAGLLDGQHPLLVIALADVVATIVIFGWSFGCNNTSLYDPYWSLAPVPIAIAWAAMAAPEAEGSQLRRLMVLALITWWAARLTYNWVLRWRGLRDEDWRYAEMRPKAGALYWPVSFLGFHLMPTVTVFLGCLPVYVVVTSPGAGFGILDVIALGVTAGAILIESISDRQLRHFIASKPPDKAMMNRGLWAFSRHPNYFGEVLFWWGLFLFGLAAAPTALAWIWLGPICMTALFLGISVPMMDRRMLRRRPTYADQMRRVSGLIPWPPRRD